LATLNGQACTSLGAGAVALDTINLGSGAGVFTPGCYSSGGAMSIDATVNLNGAGVYVFRSGGTLTSSNNTNVTVTGGACEADVFWAPGGATTLTGTSFVGNILSDNAITVAAGGTVSGRLLGYLGVLTTSGNTITKPSCTTVYPASIPTLSEWAMIIFALLLVGLGLQMQRRRQA